MHKSGSDPKVKKTLVRNYECRVKPSRKQVVHDVGCSSKDAGSISKSSQKENELSQPTLCSSEALANYLSDVKKSQPTPLSNENIDKGQSISKITKKLNFHFNDRIYKNLIELNASMDELKCRKDKRPSSSAISTKRDLEPNIEDFYQDEEEHDTAPSIPVIKPKFKPVRKVDNGQLHSLVASLEDL